MDGVYAQLGLNPEETGSLEDYLAEYFGRILQKLKERNYELDRQKRQEQEKRKRRRPFKTSAKTGSRASRRGIADTPGATGAASLSGNWGGGLAGLCPTGESCLSHPD
jgi:hypothetical protein